MIDEFIRTTSPYEGMQKQRVPISFNCEGGKKSENAEAVAKIDSDGKVSDIILLKKGYGYKKALDMDDIYTFYLDLIK